MPKILDSHIHLWPPTATRPTDHAWMTPNHPLATPHTTHHYTAATSTSPVDSQPAGFVYVETDRYLPSAAPEGAQDVRAWARAPLEELAFLRGVVEGDDVGGEGEVSVRGLVVWAPLGVGREVFAGYWGGVREVLGERGWGRVVGVRYLLQGRSAEEVRSITGNECFVANLKRACEEGEKKLAFDVGVDCHRDGVETLEAVVDLVERVGEGVKFVLNHLCKPDLSTPTWPSFPRWKSAIARLAAHPNVYMKLSGLLNEFSPRATPASMEQVLEAASPYLEHVLASFGPQRIMFGSDWPVCNVGGPRGESGNWSFWREIVEGWMKERGLSEEEREWIWGKTAAVAYGIQDF